MENKTPHLIMLSVIWCVVHTLQVGDDILKHAMPDTWFVKVAFIDGLISAVTVWLAVFWVVPKVCEGTLRIYAAGGWCVDHLCRFVKRQLKKAMWKLLDQWDDDAP